MDNNQKDPDKNLKSILSSPIKSTPAVPIPDWTPAVSLSNNVLTELPTASSNLSVLTVTIPNTVVGEPHTNVTIQNCLASVDLQTPLNLTAINARTRNSEYNPRKFHGLVMRLREPRVTTLVFKSGKIVCTGAKSEPDALLGSKKIAKIIQKLGFNIKLNNFKIHNIVATSDMKFPVKLEMLNQVHGQFSSYEPELFPGLVYRLVKPKLVVLIFANGKLVFTGAKSRVEIKQALEKIFPLLRSFRKN